MPGARERTAELWRGAMEDLIPDGAIRQRRSVAAAINPDGTIRGGAATTILPWQRIDWYIPAGAANGINVGAELRVVQGMVLRRIDALAKDAPNAAPFTAVVTDDTQPVGNVSIAIGRKAGESTANVAIASGSVLRLNVISPGGARITVTAWLQPDMED